MKSYSLSKIALGVALCCAGTQSAFADIKVADANTQVSQKAGVEIVDIATPSSSGLSHNKYNQYDVNTQGAVLNNARQSGKSQLAGELAANPNLKTQSATVILNEVVGSKASNLKGTQEIFGEKADYVLANPNGINAAGAGFINAPRASLVVGKPTVSQGKLTGYDATGDNALTTTGKITTSGDIDLIAPQVTVGGDINTTESVNVITGRNKFSRDDQGTITISAVEKKGQVLDGKLVGSIQAGRIRVHSSDDRATITAEGADLNAKDVAIVAAGNATVQGKITQHATQRDETHQRVNYETISTYSTEDRQSNKISKVKAENLNIVAGNKADISGANLQANTTRIEADSVHLGTQITQSNSRYIHNRNKGQWHRFETDSANTETLYRTTISGDDVKIVANKDKVTAEGTKITLNKGGIYGENGIDLRGAKNTKKEAAKADFKNETAKLKTGISNQDSTVEVYTATELNSNGTVILGSKGDVNLAGVTGKINGDLLVKNNGKTTFSAEKTREIYNSVDDEHYWGGLAGAKKVGTGRNAETVHGSDFTVTGKTLLDADKGVKISGSRVISGDEGYVLGNKGALVIDDVKAQVTESNESRMGTIFNITKSREKNYVQTSTSQGSTLVSQSNLLLSADKNINIIGSNVTSDGTLEIASRSGINVLGGRNMVISNTSSAGFTLGAKFENLKASLQSDYVTANVNVGNESVSGSLEVSPDKKDFSINAEGSVSVGLNIYNTTQDSQNVTYTASQLNGSDVNLNAKKVTVEGSNISATNGNLTVNADMLKTQAARNDSTVNTITNNATVGFTGTLTNSNVSGRLGIDVSHKNESNHTQTAQSSQLSASNDINLNATHIQHEGTSLKAEGNVTQNAKELIQTTAKEETNTFKRTVDVGIGIGATLDKSKALTAEGSIAANGSSEAVNSTNNIATSITAANNIAETATQITDIATNYQAGGDVVLTSNNHSLGAATNFTHKQSLSGGASVGVTASTSDFQTANLGINVGANFQKDQSTSQSAQQGSVSGKNVTINTGTLNSQANIKAEQNVNIHATEGVNFTQANNTETHSGGGFDANVGVGALVVPAATAAIPSIDISLKANGNNGNSSTAVTNSVEGQNVNISSNGTTTLQGTHVIATDNANITGAKVDITAANSSVQNTAANVTLGVNLGEKLTSAGFEAGVNVNLENSTSHNASNVNANNLNISAQNGVTLNGVSSTSENLNVNTGNGDLTLTAPQSHTNKTDVGVGANLSGGVSMGSWTPNAGGASLDVNVVRNENYTSTALNSTNADLQVGGNATFSGSNVSADTVSGEISGNSHTETLVNKINETNVSLSASGGGSITSSSDNWLGAASKDWNNGTIGGVKAQAKVDVSSTKKDTATKSGIHATQNQVNVQGRKTRNHVNNLRNKSIKFKTALSTQVKKELFKRPFVQFAFESQWGSSNH